MEVFDLKDAAWRPMQEVIPGDAHIDFNTLINSDDREGKFTWDLMSSTLNYASSLVPEIANDIVNVDRAMKWGFAWANGPFELIDLAGAKDYAKKLTDGGIQPDGMLKVLLDSGEHTFYRNNGSEYLTIDGKYEPVV